MSSPQPKLNTSDDLLLCNECGTQYPVTSSSNKTSCKICDDPRQYVPATGQVFTTLGELKEKGYKNVWEQDEEDERIWFVRTEPKFAIGQRAILLQTPHGNILWDLIALLDEETVAKIHSLGGLHAIVISHPHYYTTWSEWSRTFQCPVYVGEPDQIWLERVGSPGAEVRFITKKYDEGVLEGVTVLLAGGHFDGSLLLHWDEKLFIADTIFTSPSATNPVPGKPGVISFTFFYSIPNRIPLHPDAILSIWRQVKPLTFHACYGAFAGQDVRTRPNEQARGTGGVKGRLLESCKMYVGAMGWKGHPLLEEGL
ncbi:hypothetical protein M409DRAFT_63991 [Zasmidium cellare ATCC 36951]|uniref:Metallo-beta-lactamase domain-containing protein n=1 Tax=Zasmidium cellare ATCC 36951 TaxID=1080233 RepID=A0A6A6CVC6_ZASCE|nr:uncharacterized protein M409DRAFT_63991 [Zasmidium cellare ATCC 36951]KAF2170995.1 hypothetical protein M409DRAFT_63991 [Zasmidium cellare ATCC 36951]